MIPRLHGLWRDRDFVRLLSAAAVSAAGSQVTLLALPIAATLVLHASNFAVAALATAVTLPNLFGAGIGVWLDRTRRRGVMVAADFGRAAVLVSVPIAYGFDVLSLAQLYVVALVTGVLSVIFEIASQAYVPTLVKRVHLVEANAKLQGAMVVSQAAGPSIGGALLAVVAAPVAILADSASFLVSGLLIGSVRKREEPPQKHPVADTPTTRRTELREAARFVLSHVHLRPLLISHALANLALGLVWSIVVVYAVRVLGLSATTIGLILSLGYLGGVAGATFARRAAKRIGIGPVVLGSFFLFGPAALLLASATKHTAIAFLGVGWVLENLARSLYGVSATSIRQTLVPDQLQARVSGLLATTGTSAFPLGTLIAGALAGVFGLRAAMIVAAVASFLPFIPVAVSPMRSLRSLT